MYLLFYNCFFQTAQASGRGSQEDQMRKQQVNIVYWLYRLEFYNRPSSLPIANIFASVES